MTNFDSWLDEIRVLEELLLSYEPEAKEEMERLKGMYSSFGSDTGKISYLFKYEGWLKRRLEKYD